jgi:cell wall-associated NlpC family hydrolase
VRVAAGNARVAEQQQALNTARTALGQVAADTYEAGDLSTLSLFLSDDPDSFLAANGLLVSLGQRKADAVTNLLQQRQDLAGSLTDEQEQQQRLALSEQNLQAARFQVQKALAAASDRIHRLTGTQRGELAADENDRDEASLSDLGILMPPSGRPSCEDVPVVAPDVRTAKVLDYACARLGDPYVWAGAGPNDFDCSGLTLMAWRQAGVSLPHNAAMQATYGTRVSRDQLRPGDLVFFRSPIGHVGIYIGDGAMLHAPSSGDVVRIAPVFWSDFVAAVRL